MLQQKKDQILSVAAIIQANLPDPLDTSEINRVIDTAIALIAEIDRRFK